MRLTLRTMLAYLDDILEPADAEALGKKIEESEFASGLVHRIRSSMRRLRLEAPRLDGKGAGLDPNTVAEYLDNTLPQERVPDVEKVCLESDVHLAEVASCHQILTIVLGEPADVKGELRQRIYRLGHAASAPAAGEEADGAAHTAPVLPSESSSAPPPVDDQPPVQAAVHASEPTAKQRDVPAYLRGKSGVRLAPLAITLVLAFVLAAAGLVALGGLDRNGFLWRTFGGQSTEPIAQSGGGDSSMSLPAPESPEVASARDESDPANAAAANENDETVQPAGAGSLEIPEASEVADAPDAAADTDATPAADAATVDDNQDAASPTIADATPPGEGAPPTSSGRTPTPPQPAGDAPAAAAPSAAAIGRYISEREVLARFDADQKTWLRLPQRAPLNSGDMLLAGPAYRPQILLATAIQITADGPTSLQLHEGDSADVVRLAIEFGRASIVTVGKAGAQIELVFGGRHGVAVFGDAESEMAVEVQRYLPPGVDPETAAPQVAVEIFATSGHLEWRDGAAAPVQIKAGQVYRFIDEMPPQLIDAAGPAWIHRTETTIEDFAARDLETFLTTDRSLRLSLAEKLDFRKNEVRSLAARMLAYLDDFEPIIQQFGDDQLHSFWHSGLDSLRECTRRSPATAALVRQAFERIYGDRAAELHRLVWGYDRTQFETGEAEKLIDLLDHPELPFRVLAFENLHRIADATHGYAAYFVESRRRRFVRIWRDRLAEGMVSYQESLAPFSDSPPSAAKP